MRSGERIGTLVATEICQRFFRAMNAPGSGLVAQRVYKTLGNQQVLSDVSASVTAGRGIALLGPNGSGKSTFVRAISLVDPPDRGTIFVDDVCFDCPLPGRLPRPVPWPKVTCVFQQFFLWPHM